LLPKPKWGVAEVALIAVAVLVGGVVGPHLLATYDELERLEAWYCCLQAELDQYAAEHRN
jgi:hypothetical protein